MKRQVSFFNVQALTSCISMTLVLLLLGAVTFFVLSAHSLSKQVRENIAITLLMSDDATNSDLEKIQKNLKAKRYVKQIDYISKEKALLEMTFDMGADPTDFIGHNPFSASLEVGLKADYANPDSIKWIAKDLQKTPKVIDMVYQQEWVDTINTMIEKISVVLLIIATLLTMVSFALINNTLRLSVYSNRFSIHTMKLVGASWSFIRRPFLWKSMVLGLIAAVVADFFLALGVSLLLQQEPELMDILSPQILFIVGGVVLIFGLLITLICAYVSVSRFLNMRAQDLYTA